MCVCVCVWVWSLVCWVVCAVEVRGEEERSSFSSGGKMMTPLVSSSLTTHSPTHPPASSWRSITSSKAKSPAFKSFLHSSTSCCGGMHGCVGGVRLYWLSVSVCVCRLLHTRTP